MGLGQRLSRLGSLGAWLRGLRRPGKGRFFFIVNNRNHVRILTPIVRRLAELSLPCIIADIERESGDRGARRELAAMGLSSVSLDELKDEIGRSDALIVANDFYPDAVIETMELAGRRGTLRIGIVEGCRFVRPERYRRVDHLLAWSAACHDAFEIPVHAVGSPIIEEAWRRPASFATPEYAVINYKIPGHTAEERQAWIEQATAACQAVGLPFQISSHPSVPPPAGYALAREEFRDLMPNASVLISQPSTVVFEAMAAGKPVVLFPAGDEGLVEFAEPMGAYDIARGSEDLVAMLRTALAGKDSYRDGCRAFFEHHVDIDPQIGAVERIVQTVIGLAQARIAHGRDVQGHAASATTATG